MTLTLVTPSLAHLPGYTAALERGWSPEGTRESARVETLKKIAHDAAAFVASLDDRDGTGAPVKLPDGSMVPRLPGYHRWIWDGEFCGLINVRWKPGTTELPPTCLGHVGYQIVPWKQRRGYATKALRMFLPELAATGLPYIHLTTDPGNLPSQKVILANGGVLEVRFAKPAQHGGGEGWRFRIALS